MKGRYRYYRCRRSYAGPRADLDREIGEVEAKQRRLVKLFTSGELPETLLEAESRGLAEQRARLESERGRLRTGRRAGLDLDQVERRLPEVLETIERWCASGGEDRLRLLVTALDVQLQASRETVEISGSVPLIDSSDYADLVTIERTSASPFRGDQIERVPFSLSVPIH